MPYIHQEEKNIKHHCHMASLLCLYVLYEYEYDAACLGIGTLLFYALFCAWYPERLHLQQYKKTNIDTALQIMPYIFVSDGLKCTRKKAETRKKKGFQNTYVVYTHVSL